MDAVRGPAAAARRDRRAARRDRDPPSPGDLRGSDQGGADRAADQGGARLGCDHRRRALPAADRAVLQGRGRRRGGHLRHPRHHRLRGARLRRRRAAEPEAVHLRAGRPGHRRRLRHLHGRAAPDAHGRGGCPRRLRRRRRPHHAQCARHPGADGHRGGGRGRRPPGLHGRVRRPLCPRDRRRRSGLVRRSAQGRRLRRRRRDGGLPAGPRHRRARPGTALGHGGRPRGRAARQAGRPRHRGHHRGGPDGPLAPFPGPSGQWLRGGGRRPRGPRPGCPAAAGPSRRVLAGHRCGAAGAAR